MNKSPIHPVSPEARALAHELMGAAKFASLGVIDPETQTPFVSRISFWYSADRTAMTLVSGMASHAKALAENRACSVLIGEPPTKGDPLAFPRLTIQAEATILPRESFELFRSGYLAANPKSKLYIDLPDFRFVRFDITGAFLNAGFGKAFRFKPEELK